MANTDRIVSRRKKRAPSKVVPLKIDIVINVNENYQLRHWAKQFDVTDAELFAAVEQVGPIAEHVRNYFLGLDQPPGQQE